MKKTETAQQIYPTCNQINKYEVKSQWLITGYETSAICLELLINDEQQAWLTCEAAGGAVILWYEDPSDGYEDRVHSIWNMSVQNEESGYITEPAGAFNQWIFPVDNISDPDCEIAQTPAESELYQFAALLAGMLC